MSISTASRCIVKTQPFLGLPRFVDEPNFKGAEVSGKRQDLKAPPGAIPLGTDPDCGIEAIQRALSIPPEPTSTEVAA